MTQRTLPNIMNDLATLSCRNRPLASGAVPRCRALSSESAFANNGCVRERLMLFTGDASSVRLRECVVLERMVDAIEGDFQLGAKAETVETPLLLERQGIESHSSHVGGDAPKPEGCVKARG